MSVVSLKYVKILEVNFLILVNILVHVLSVAIHNDQHIILLNETIVLIILISRKSSLGRFQICIMHSMPQ